MEKQDLLRFKGESNFRTRVLLSTLSGRPIRIDDIRTNDIDDFGLRDYEISFLKLIELLTNGSIIEINDTGTSLYYKPGILIGGTLNFDCPLSKSIGYFLEMILPLVPFSKYPLRLTMTGVTNDSLDPSVDSIRMVSLSLLRKFGIVENLDIKIKKRGWFPGGGGEILFTCPIVARVHPVQWIDEGKIKRIRGLAACTRVSPQVSNRLVERSKNICLKFIPDVHIYTDVHQGSDIGKTPGFSLTLVAESTTGSLIMAEGVSEPGLPPEDLCISVTNSLFWKIHSFWSCCDPSRQWLGLLLMALASEDVSMMKFSSILTPFTMEFLREMKIFLGIIFKLKEENVPISTSVSVKKSNSPGSISSPPIISSPNSSCISITATCVGIGYINYSMRTT